jgi:hypothetical protein
MIVSDNGTELLLSCNGRTITKSLGPCRRGPDGKSLAHEGVPGDGKRHVAGQRFLPASSSLAHRYGEQNGVRLLPTCSRSSPECDNIPAGVFDLPDGEKARSCGRFAGSARIVVPISDNSTNKIRRTGLGCGAWCRHSSVTTRVGSPVIAERQGMSHA